MSYRSEDGLFEIAEAYDKAIAPILKVLCLKCGVRVVYNQEEMQIHRVFHENIDEIIDWARSVSELFKRPVAYSGESSRTNAESNAGIVERGIKDSFQNGSSEEGLQKGSE